MVKLEWTFEGYDELTNELISVANVTAPQTRSVRPGQFIGKIGITNRGDRALINLHVYDRFARGLVSKDESLGFDYVISVPRLEIGDTLTFWARVSATINEGPIQFTAAEQP